MHIFNHIKMIFKNIKIVAYNIWHTTPWRKQTNVYDKRFILYHLNTSCCYGNSIDSPTIWFVNLVMKIDIKPLIKHKNSFSCFPSLNLTPNWSLQVPSKRKFIMHIHSSSLTSKMEERSFFLSSIPIITITTHIFLSTNAKPHS